LTVFAFFFITLPIVLVAGWVATFYIRRPLRWLWYFTATFALMGLLVGGFFVQPRHPCQESGLACMDGWSFFAVGNLLFGFWTWVALLVITCLFEAGVAIASAARPPEGGDDTGRAGEPAEQPEIGRAGAAEPHPIKLPDSGNPGGGLP
jgi:hypothetical protein